jgi:geranylgeranyl pyrophosphate synthase
MLQEIKEIEKTIGKYFFSNWKKDDIAFWIGKEKFEIDYSTINKNLNNPVRNFILRKGKRWRPVLFLTTLRLFGVDWKKHLDVAFALELAHNATLVIDDIEDNAELRRGKPTLHKIFGTDIAVNTGSAMYFLPLKILLGKKNINEKQRLDLLQIYIEEMINVHFGQTLDISWHTNPHQIKIDQYLEMTRLKTGALVRMSERMSCVLTGKEKLEKDIIQFAEIAGIAFQIKDDCLEFTSNEKIFGKTYGNDIMEGKISLPIIFALQNSSQKEKEKLLNILTKHTHNKELLKEAMDLVKKSGAVEKSLEYADELIESAWKKIEKKLPRNKENLKDFKELTYSLIKREK